MTHKHCSDCPCGKCEYLRMKINEEPCRSCSVLNWSKFKLMKPTTFLTNKFVFRQTEMYECPECGSMLQEEGEIRKLDIEPLSWYWDGNGVLACPNCGFERDDR